MDRVVRLQKHGGQYRVTLPRELIIKAGFEDVEFVKLYRVVPGRIVIEEYYGREKEKGDLPEGQS